jgi:thiamine kinase-like enzyme
VIPEQIASSLYSQDRLVFAANHEMIVSWILEGTPTSRLTEVLLGLDQSNLTESERDHRARTIISKAPHDFVNQKSVVEALALLPSRIKSAIGDALDLENIPLLSGKYDRNKREVTTEYQFEDETVKVVRIPQEDLSIQELSSGNVVLALATHDNQTANIGLLKTNNFAAYRLFEEDAILEQLKSPDICGFIIDGSYWLNKTPEQQIKSLKQIASYSSIACFFIDRTNFHSPDQIQDIIRSEFQEAIKYRQLHIQDNSSLSKHDLIKFIEAKDHLQRSSKTSYVLADLTLEETIALTATASDFYLEKYGRGDKNFETLSIGFIQNDPRNNSSAKICTLKFNNTGIPVVAKIARRSMIIDEIDRFKKYIVPIEHLLNPFCRYHADIGVIIFSLVEDAIAPLRGAPTLDSKIEKTWIVSQWTPDFNMDSIGADIVAIINRTAEKLKNINARKCTDHSVQSFGYVNASNLIKYADSVGNIRIGELTLTELQERILECKEYIKDKLDLAIIHGDLHLKNILVRDVHDPFLIDYAYSGPGHPTYDLIRLECALLFNYLIIVDSEEAFAKLQFDLSNRDISFAKLKEKYPEWFLPKLNSVLLECAVLCRDKCFEVLDHFKLDPKEYLASKYLICCTELAIPNLQKAQIRGAIHATYHAFSGANHPQPVVPTEKQLGIGSTVE